MGCTAAEQVRDLTLWGLSTRFSFTADAAAVLTTTPGALSSALALTPLLPAPAVAAVVIDPLAGPIKPLAAAPAATICAAPAAARAWALLLEDATRLQICVARRRVPALLPGTSGSAGAPGLPLAPELLRRRGAARVALAAGAALASAASRRWLEASFCLQEGWEDGKQGCEAAGLGTATATGAAAALALLADAGTLAGGLQAEPCSACRSCGCWLGCT